MDSAPAQLILAQAAPDAFTQFVPLALILAVFYFLVIRPQQQKAKEHEDFVKGLKKGELVVTQSGLFGRVVEIRDHDVTLEIAPNVKVRYERLKISAAATAAGSASKAEG
jgi:preprotein translocase subunit YajC